MKKTSFQALAIALTLATSAYVGTGCGGGEGKVDVQAQVQQLKGTDKDAKITALVELSKAKEGALPALDALVAALQDPDADVRDNAAATIGEIGPKASKAIPALKKLMESSERNSVAAAMNAIRAIDPKALPSEFKLPNVQ